MVVFGGEAVELEGLFGWAPLAVRAVAGSCSHVKNVEALGARWASESPRAATITYHRLSGQRRIDAGAWGAVWADGTTVVVVMMMDEGGEKQRADR